MILFPKAMCVKLSLILLDYILNAVSFNEGLSKKVYLSILLNVVFFDLHIKLAEKNKALNPRFSKFLHNILLSFHDTKYQEVSLISNIPAFSQSQHHWIAFIIGNSFRRLNFSLRSKKALLFQLLVQSACKSGPGLHLF